MKALQGGAGQVRALLNPVDRIPPPPHKHMSALVHQLAGVEGGDPRRELRGGIPDPEWPLTLNLNPSCSFWPRIR